VIKDAPCGAGAHISLFSVPVNNNSTTIPLKTYPIQHIKAYHAYKEGRAISGINVIL
jgi:hypothetical protein